MHFSQVYVPKSGIAESRHMYMFIQSFSKWLKKFYGNKNNFCQKMILESEKSTE